MENEEIVAYFIEYFLFHRQTENKNKKIKTVQVNNIALLSVKPFMV